MIDKRHTSFDLCHLGAAWALSAGAFGFMVLPEEMEIEFEAELTEFEKEKSMEYITKVVPLSLLITYFV